MRLVTKRKNVSILRGEVILLLLLPLFLSPSVHSQTLQESWIQTHGGSSADVCYDMVPTSDGNFIAVGYTYSFGAGLGDFYAIKLDNNGNILWEQTYGGTNSDAASAVYVCSDGYVMIGKTKSFGIGRYDACLIKTDTNGNTVWTNTFGGFIDDEGCDVIQTHDGGFAIAGITKSMAVGEQDMYLVKTDAGGQLEWEKAYGDFYKDEAYAVLQTNDNGYLLAGHTRSFGEVSGDIFVVRTNSSGDTLWTRRYGGSEDEWGYDMLKTPDNGFLIAGITSSYGAGDYDYYLIKISAGGDLIWEKTYGGYDTDYCQSFIQTTDGGYMLAGYTSSYGNGGFDQYLVKVDENGNLEGETVVGETENDFAAAVVQLAEFSYISAGYTYSYNAEYCNVLFVGLSSGNQPPVAVAGNDLCVEGTSYEGAEVQLDASGSTDPDNDPLTYTWFKNGNVLAGPGPVSVSTVPLSLGQHEIVLLVEDGRGESDSDTLLVTVEDTTPPEGQLVLDPSVLWPPNYKMVPVTATLQLSDLCDPDVSFVLTSITCNESNILYEKLKWKWLSDIQDAEFGTADTEFTLRAKRNFRSQGRYYVVEYTATDFSGNTTILSDTVWVLNWRKKKCDSSPEMANNLTPLTYAMENNYPNPFNPETIIPFQLPETEHVTLNIYNAYGRKVRTLTDQMYPAGIHTVIWNSLDDSGSPVASGLYICRIKAGHFTAIQKMNLVR